jgi:uncharacterized protein YycO
MWVAANESCPPGYTDPNNCPGGGGDSQADVPSYLEVGDLLFVEARPWVRVVFGVDVPGWDHVAMYVGGGLFIEAGDYPGTHVVTYAPLGFYCLWASEIAYGRVVTADESQRLGAVAFAECQLYQPYQDPYVCWWANANPNDPDDPYSNEFYCSELVWAAYVHEGINIDATPDPPSPEEGGDGVHLYVSPQDIADDDDVVMYLNGPPSTPTRPSGPTDVRRLQTRLYSSSSSDPENDLIYYQWDWDEGLVFWDLLPHVSGTTTSEAHTWLALGYHQVRVRAKDVFGHESDWSPPLTVLVRSWFGGNLAMAGVESSAANEASNQNELIGGSQDSPPSGAND